ncbi:MAG: hypothetical protein OXU64_13365 [Gemmatimonadota bacterium]|nr:hypothetical protein [Gemmatimonadota bacterium]
MRNTATLLALAALAACDPEAGPPQEVENHAGAATLTGPETAEALPPAPPLWRIDPAVDPNGALLDGVPQDPERGVPPALRGLRDNVNVDWGIRSHSRPGFHAGWSSPALSREDFRRGSRECLEHMRRWNWDPWLDFGDYQSVELQTFWYASLRAKEAVYGAGAVEAACERELLENALHVARGNWREVYARNPNRESILAEAEETEAREARYWGLYDEQWPADPAAAARLELWLKCDG